MFSEEKVAQMAAYLLLKRGGRMAYIKLMKLLYLSDRQSLITYGDSMSGDKAVSMDHGPVLSRTYNLLKGGSSDDSAWNRWIAGESNWEVSIKKRVSGLDDTDSFDELSRADIRILDSVFATYGHMRRFEICDLTHEICPEWHDPDGSSIPINPREIFRAAGKTEDEADAMMVHLQEHAMLREFNAKLS
ncbi:Panacea domain-containing protein [Pluralibacter gergoviae]|uniref:Panacea domain-containing protein n=1 Tax=Pluralibacter gergoviae TaxID=61647 RepID=A0AAW8HT86_PLUGE|nr:Panacea domain-containing protein [Pluralibacter gergoviae]KMK04051.1 hypothetical protein ABW08_13020 [Pluralibacter gergoviae]KMK28490.1 hypothetical protein ABW11_09640 [Pluralibacter gergoviae]MDQ2310288.1 Panacea domain-containing protein [Pluralibacter gergoviae]